MINDLVARDHPKQKLIFFLAEDADDIKRSEIKKMIADLAPKKDWVIGPPGFLDVIEGDDSQDGEMKIETLGGVHEIYSALPPNDLAREVDRLHFEEVELIIKAVQNLSLEKNMVFEFELDGVFVGAIEHGDIDSTMRFGLMDEWRKHLF